MSRSTMWSCVRSLILLLGAGVLGGNAFAASPRLVELQGAAQPLGRLQERPARERGEVPKDISGDQLQAFLAKPDGNGPFAAVVVLHGCNGVQSASDRLVSRGYVALLVDSYTPRRIDHACTPEKYAAEESNILKRTFDAYGALLFLTGQPFVDPRRVAVVGASQGGMVTLSVAEERTFELFVNPRKLVFRAAVALYPPCFLAGARPSIPTLILVGELDDWTKGLRADTCALGKHWAHPFSSSQTPVLIILSMHPASNPVK